MVLVVSSTDSLFFRNEYFVTPMMINFLCQFWLRDAQIAGKTFCLGISVREFLKEKSIWINRVVKKRKIVLPSVGGPHLISWRSEQNRKAKERQICSFAQAELGHLSSPALRCQFLVLRPLDSDWMTPLAFSYPTCRGRPSAFLASITMLENSYNKFLCICVYVYNYNYILYIIWWCNIPLYFIYFKC